MGITYFFSFRGTEQWLLCIAVLSGIEIGQGDERNDRGRENWGPIAPDMSKSSRRAENTVIPVL